MSPNGNYVEWLTHAKEDFESAKELSQSEQVKFRNTCYFCHQTAEKALKAFIIFMFKKHRFIHDLEELCLDCQKIDPSFSALQNDCYILNNFYEASKYPCGISLGELEMRQALTHAENILNFVISKINTPYTKEKQ
jgi:HEPN domain-containing protein